MSSAPARALFLVACLGLAGCVHPPSPYTWSHYARALDLPAAGAVPFQPKALQGKVVLVNFLATWCLPCLTDLPTLAALQRAHDPAELVVVAVGLDREGALVLEPFAAQYQLPFPVLVGSEALLAGETPFGRIKALPTTFVLGRDGTVLAAFQGAISPKPLGELVDRALAAPRP